MSAYAPIRAPNGKVVGLLEVDIAAESYFTRLRSLLWVTGALGCVALLLASLLGWPLLNATIIRPIGRLRAGMLALGCHDFTHRVELRTGDEFEALGRTLNQVSEQLNAARAIQSRFFPKTMPDLPGFCLAGMSTPSEAAGGDYLDALQLGPDRAALLVADVSGHGLGPALLMATCRATVRALARADPSPADLLEGLETVLRADLSAGQFVTMLYGVLESDGTFTYANAGHGPALLLQGDAVRSLEAHRFPLGMDLPFEPGAERQSSITLSPGDRLLVATDGLVDATGADGEPFGVEPVEGAMRDRSCNCRQLVARLEEGIRSHCRDAPQTDDITILCVDRA
jgi:serine phosphatase RsbU (regulator of sigma subunit)